MYVGGECLSGVFPLHLFRFNQQRNEGNGTKFLLLRVWAMSFPPRLPKSGPCDKRTVCTDAFPCNEHNGKDLKMFKAFVSFSSFSFS